MRSASRYPSLVGLLALLLASSLGLHCKAKSKKASEKLNTLRIEFLSVDTDHAPRGGRPFIAGEQVRIALRVEGGRPPYDFQLVTSQGPPTLASGSTRVESIVGSSAEVAMTVNFASETVSGNYGLLLRVSDDEGQSASVRSAPFDVVGSDAVLARVDLSRAPLQIVDVAGRARASFYQGEEIRIRAKVVAKSPVKVGIFASDDRPFMPVQEYQAPTEQFELGLRIPRMARVGKYRVQVAGQDLEASAELEVVGASFSAARTPLLEELQITGGPDLRVPRGALLLRGEMLRFEARVGGVQYQAEAKLRLRNQSGKVVAHAALGEIVPVDPHPEARSLLAANWTPAQTLPVGRHVIEIEIVEGDQLSTLYREVEIR